MTPIPALIVSGYLGAGKTTLVQHLLEEAQAEGVRLAIISNEFGDTGIDRALLDSGKEGFVELDGGCVCCKLSDALGETLQVILDQVKPDRIVLECSGVALPGEVLVQFWRPPVDELVSEEVVVVVVDAEKLLSTPVLEDTFLQQVESADLFMLNKADLVDEEGLVEAEARLAKLSGGQPVIRSVYSEVEPSLLFPPDPEAVRTRRRDPDAELAPHVHERFTTTELVFDQDIDPDTLLAEVASHDAVRAKGFVRTKDGIRVLQGVGPRIELKLPETDVDESMLGRVVIIHRELGVDVHAHEEQP